MGCGEQSEESGLVFFFFAGQTCNANIRSDTGSYETARGSFICPCSVRVVFPIGFHLHNIFPRETRPSLDSDFHIHLFRVPEVFLGHPNGLFWRVVGHELHHFLGFGRVSVLLYDGAVLYVPFLAVDD